LEIEALRSELLRLKTARISVYRGVTDGGYNARSDLTSKAQQKKKNSGPGDEELNVNWRELNPVLGGASCD